MSDSQSDVATNWSPYAPKTILEFPRVEYIPISTETLGHGRLPADAPRDMLLEHIPSAERYRSLVAGYNLAVVARRPPDPVHNLTVLALNMKVEACFYRGLKAVLVAKPDPGHFQVFEMARRYFYKDAFQLVAVDEAGRPMAQALASLVPEATHSLRIGLFPPTGR